MSFKYLIGTIVVALIAAVPVTGQEPATKESATKGLAPFSWERVPVSVHFGIGEGLKPDQYDVIAEHFDFVTLTAGRLSRATKGSAEMYTAKQYSQNRLEVTGRKFSASTTLDFTEVGDPNAATLRWKGYRDVLVRCRFYSQD